ncbi:hypothetical protein [Enterococcus larvae]|uniref:hypothetical protein n=1 Tax=Enterococcus larvae TaxID=2794352 RepID=UPI003F2AF304
MNKFKALVQLQVRGYGLNKLRHQSKTKLTAIVIGAVLLTVLAISYLLGIGFLLIEMGLKSYVPGMMVFLSSIICLVLTFMKGSGFLFGFRDFDTLMALPIAPQIITMSKVFSLYLLNLLFSFIALVPSMLLYCWHTRSIWPLLGTLVILPFVPLLPLILGVIVTTVISLIASNFRYQQLVVVLLSLGGVVALMAGSISLTNYDNAQLNELLKNGLLQLESSYPLLKLINSGFSNQPFLLLVFIILSVLPALLFLALLNRYYLQINAKLSLRVRKSVFKLETFKQRNLFRSLLEKEVRLYFSSALYVTNSIIGVILFLAAALSVPFLLDQLRTALPEGMTIQQFLPWLPYVPCLFLGITTTTSAAISMEGKSDWQYASLPIPIGKIYAAKLAVNLLLFLPALWVGCAALIFSLSLTGFSAFLLFLFPSCFCIFMAMIGLKLNQMYPNFKWTNEQQPIKQSIPVLVTMLIGLLSIVLSVGAAFLLGHSGITILLSSAILLVISYITWRSMHRKNVFVHSSVS